MDPGVAIPLTVFAVIVVIVALVHFVRIHDLEVDVQHRIHRNEVEHQEKIGRLEEEIKALRGGN